MCEQTGTFLKGTFEYILESPLFAPWFASVSVQKKLALGLIMPLSAVTLHQEIMARTCINYIYLANSKTDCMQKGCTNTLKSFNIRSLQWTRWLCFAHGFMRFSTNSAQVSLHSLSNQHYQHRLFVRPVSKVAGLLSLVLHILKPLKVQINTTKINSNKCNHSKYAHINTQEVNAQGLSLHGRMVRWGAIT